MPLLGMRSFDRFELKVWGREPDTFMHDVAQPNVSKEKKKASLTCEIAMELSMCWPQIDASVDGEAEERYRGSLGRLANQSITEPRLRDHPKVNLILLRLDCHGSNPVALN